LCVVAKTDPLHATTNAGQQTDAIQRVLGHRMVSFACSSVAG
jgi:hypothetical protein